MRLLECVVNIIIYIDSVVTTAILLFYTILTGIPYGVYVLSHLADCYTHTIGKE